MTKLHQFFKKIRTKLHSFSQTETKLRLKKLDDQLDIFKRK